MSPVSRRLLGIALPAIASNITVPLLGLVDSAIVGHLGSASYIAAVAVGTTVFNVVYWTLGFLRMATSGLAAQSFGANNPQMSFLVLLRSLAISLALAALLLLLGHPLFEGALWIMHPTPETSQLSSIYFHILLFGAPAMLCQMSLTGWFVGMQDTRSTLVVALVQNVVNIIASSLLVFGIGLKVEGVALGTLIAQWTAAGTGYLIFRKRYAHIRSNIPLALVLSKRGFSRLLRVSRDLFFRTLCLVSVMLFLTVAGSWMGDTTLAANTLLMQFYLLLSYIMDGFAYAGEALSGEAMGACVPTRLSQLVHCLFGWGSITALAFTLAYALGGNDILSLLTSETHVLSHAHSCLPWLIALPLTATWALLWDGIYVGLTMTRQMFLTSALATACFFLSYVLSVSHLGVHGLWLAFLLFLFVRGFSQWMVYRFHPVKI